MGSSSCQIRRGSASKKSWSSMTVSCTSAPIARATSREYSSSLKARSLKATEKVWSGRSIWRAMIAAMALLSMPPDRNTPSGTSLISRSLTDSSSSSRKRGTTAGLLMADRSPSGTSQYCRMRRVPSSKTRRCPGASRWIEWKSVSVPAMDRVLSTSGMASSRGAAGTSPLASSDLISEPNSSVSPRCDQ
jgi:hypothetical protein